MESRRAPTTPKIIACETGLRALWSHRVSHWLLSHDFQLVGRALSALTRWLNGVDTPRRATLGAGRFVDHATDVVTGRPPTSA